MVDIGADMVVDGLDSSIFCKGRSVWCRVPLSSSVSLCRLRSTIHSYTQGICFVHDVEGVEATTAPTSSYGRFDHML